MSGHRINSKKSKHMFTKYAQRTAGRNIRVMPMRGGFRI